MTKEPVAVIEGFGCGTGTCAVAATAGINAVFTKIHACYQDHPVKIAVYNAAHGVWKPFLVGDIQAVMQTHIEEEFTFSNNLSFEKNVLDDTVKRNALILAGATPSTRGSATTSAFSAGKHALRSLSQSLVKEFGKQNIMSHIILVTMVRKNHHDPEWGNNEDARLSPKGVTETFNQQSLAAGDLPGSLVTATNPYDNVSRGVGSGTLRDLGGTFSPGESVVMEVSITSGGMPCGHKSLHQQIFCKDRLRTLNESSIS
ncbi:hypothetical protein ARMGADRAFT_1064252 [Armillaria gallica]|uniref:Uncharacterized protein n=1 Tax=Armillaria gallica TaxID=47427 RepID=A0A2H3D6J6_ARMGA|nr:hypothetical protein ARMGADRAFT_1064252 [Armillaria gallica]